MVSTAIAEYRSGKPPAKKEKPPISMLEIINRAAFDPDVDADKVQKLMEMARQVRADDAKSAYTKAMLKVKLELPIIDRKGTIKIYKKGLEPVEANLIQSTPYARWEDIDAAITPILNRNGFTLTHKTGFLDDGRVTVTAVVTHEMGHSEESAMAMPLDTSGSKNNVQAIGSSISYGKRYTASALLNLRTKGEDDDGNYAGEPGKIDAEQLQKIGDLIASTKADTKAFCEFMCVASLPDILAKDFAKAVTALNLKATKQAVKAST